MNKTHTCETEDSEYHKGYKVAPSGFDKIEKYLQKLDKNRL